MFYESIDTFSLSYWFHSCIPLPFCKPALENRHFSITLCKYGPIHDSNTIYYCYVLIFILYKYKLLTIKICQSFHRPDTAYGYQPYYYDSSPPCYMNMASSSFYWKDLFLYLKTIWRETEGLKIKCEIWFSLSIFLRDIQMSFRSYTGNRSFWMRMKYEVPFCSLLQMCET